MLALLLGGCARDCGGPGGAKQPGPPPPTPQPPQAHLETGLTFPIEPSSTSAVEAVPVFTALRFERPVFLAYAPGQENRLHVIEQAGRVLAFERRDDVAQREVFLDMRKQVRTQHNEEGLLGLAFHPDYQHTRAIYLYYSASSPRRTVLSRMTADSDGRRVVEGSEEVLLEIEQPWGNHNGGMLAFGPDGYLYVGVGDGGAARDPNDVAQDRSSLLGKILRLEVQPDRPGHRVPPDNPFVGDPQARPEIFALGLRNPWRFSFDRQTGDLWCGDVGQDELEEIDLVRAGGNYGWRLFEGTRSFSSSRHVPGEPLQPPIVEYGRDLGESVTGGYVYRGTGVPALRGAYVYGDYVTGRVWALRWNGNQVVSNEEIARVPGLASFGEDAEGELYGVGLGGTLYRFQARSTDDAGPAFPTLLSQTGLFVDTARLEPSASMISYEVASELWSDGAHKQRWLVLPPGETIGFDPEGAWSFPVGTVTVKHFELETSGRAGSQRRRIETRVMVHERHGWAGYTYQWNDAQNDAELVTSPRYESVALGNRDQTWYIPAGTDCLRCHTPGYGEVLGLRTRQLAGGNPSIVAQWNARGLFGEDIGDPSRFAAHPRQGDVQASTRDRARAYLDVNCAICHHRGGPAPGGIDMRVQTETGQMNLIDVRPDAPLGLPSELRIAPGDRKRSSVWGRMQATGHGRMPPIASRVVDEAALDVIGEWIEGLPSR